jgi:hypothetical protein
MNAAESKCEKNKGNKREDGGRVEREEEEGRVD